MRTEALTFWRAGSHKRPDGGCNRGNQLRALTRRGTKEFDYAAFQALHGKSVLPLFLIRAGGEVALFTADSPPTPQAGEVLISLARAADEATPKEP